MLFLVFSSVNNSYILSHDNNAFLSESIDYNIYFTKLLLTIIFLS